MLPVPYLSLKADGEKKCEVSEMWAEVPFVFSLSFLLQNDVGIRLSSLKRVSEC